jgi:glutaredoxin 3
VLIYCTARCPYCQAADRLLARKGVSEIERVRVDLNPARRRRWRS